MLIQSGGDFTVHKFQVESSQERLQANAVYVNVCAMYCDMAAMASRTFLVNPKDEQKAAYILAYEAQEMLIQNLRPGNTIAQAHQMAKTFVSGRNPNVQCGSNFGFGIGFTFKEDSLAITADNQTGIEVGMTFHIRVALTNVHKEPSRSVVAIGDTVLVGSEKNEVITGGVQRKYNEISYSLEDSESEKEEVKAARTKPAKAPAKKSAAKKAESDESYDDEDMSGGDEEGSDEIVVEGRTGTSVLKSTRLRSKANDQKAKQSDLDARKDHQMKLYNEKQEELKIRFNRGEICATAKKEKVKNMETLQAFKSVDAYPKDIVPGQIYVDTKRNAVLIPNSPKTFIPFHVSCIKSVSDTVQGQWTFLRINFHVGQSTTMHYPPMEADNDLWIKELTMKTKSSSTNNRLSVASRQIKECLKLVK